VLSIIYGLSIFLWDDKLVDDENIIPNDLKPYYNNKLL
jgi:hypothetical protein